MKRIFGSTTAMAVALAVAGLIFPTIAKADEVYMIPDALGGANYTSPEFDISGFQIAGIQVCGVGGTAFGTVSIQWRNTVNDDYKEIGSFADPGTGNSCQGMYGPGIGYVKAVLSYGGPGTFRVTLKRAHS